MKSPQFLKERAEKAPREVSCELGRAGGGGDTCPKWKRPSREMVGGLSLSWYPRKWFHVALSMLGIGVGG